MSSPRHPHPRSRPSQARIIALSAASSRRRAAFRTTLVWLALAAAVLVLATGRALADEAATQAAAPTPAAKTLQVLDRIEKTYAETQSVHESIGFAVIEEEGRTTVTTAFDVQFAFDRENKRLLVDRPDFRLVIRDGRLYVRFPQFPGGHMDAPFAGAISSGAIEQLLPQIAQPPLPTLAWYSESSPEAVLRRTLRSVMPPEEVEGEAGEADRIALRWEGVPGMSGRGVQDLRMEVVETTGRIARVVQDFDVSSLPGFEGDGLRFELDVDVEKLDEPLDEGLFAFDTRGSTGFDSLGALIAAAQSGQLRGPGGGGATAGEASGDPAGGEFVEAADFTLKTPDGEEFTLSKAKEDVIVLDFWASWCRPCIHSLPQWQEIQDWADREDKSIGVYALNLDRNMEPEKLLELFAREDLFGTKLTLPILLDATEVARAYNVTTIPRAFIVHDGRIVDVKVGASPDPKVRAEATEAMKKQLTELLDKADGDVDAWLESHGKNSGE